METAQPPLFPPPIPSPPSPALKNGGFSRCRPSVVIVALVLADPVFAWLLGVERRRLTLLSWGSASHCTSSPGSPLGRRQW